MQESELDLRSLIKPTDGPVSRHINRRISTRITRIIVTKNVPLTPDEVSVISFLLAIASGIAFYLGMPFLGGILAQISSIIDGVDGELARARGMMTKRGGFLDTMLDRLADIMICAGMIVYLAEDGLSLIKLLVGLLAVTGSVLPAYLAAEANARSINVDLFVPPNLRPPASRDVRLFIVLLGGITGLILPSLVLLAAITYINTIMKICLVYYRMRR